MRRPAPAAGLFLAVALSMPTAGDPRAPVPSVADPDPSSRGGTTATVTRGPYLQLGTPTGIVVRFRTDVATDGRVLFGDQPGNLTSSVVDPSVTTEHVVPLTGLSPGTTYYYAIGSSTEILAGDDPDHFFVTPPSAGIAAPLRIWVLGDSGTASAGALAVRDAYYAYTGSRHTDLWLMLGDNAYPSGTDAEYQTTLFDVYPTMLRRSVLWPTLGNHDGASADSATQTGPYYDIFTLPRFAEAGGLASGTEAYHSFDVANVHFVVLDSFETDRSPTGDMLTWLDQDLGATMQDWIVAFWHHPPYSKGSHNSDTELPLVEMRQNVVPLLDAHGVDLTLSGHSHSYERSFLIDGHYGLSTTLDASMVLDGGDGRPGGDGAYTKPDPGPVPHTGIVHTVAGSSGQISGGGLNHPAMFRSLNLMGSVVLDVDGNRLDAIFLDQDGVIEDSFTVIKGCPEQGKFTSLRPDLTSGSPVLTPGYCDNGPPCDSDIGSSVSSSFEGAFWMVGSGDLALGAGVDNGASPALEGEEGGWVRFDPGEPAFVDGRWSADARVDGCVGDVPQPRCMGMLLGDQRLGRGYFAALSTPADPSDDFSFLQPGSAPVGLATLPRPAINGTQSVNPHTVQVFSAVNAVPPEGLYLDSAQCPAGAVVGYKIYEQRTSRSGPAPLDRTRDDGDPSTGWEVAAGGEGPSGEALPIGSPTTLTFTCYTAMDIFLATSYVFESGFETPFVSFNSPRILCSFCEVDADQDGSCGLLLSGLPGPDCNDDDSSVWAKPSEVRNVRFAQGSEAITWDAPLPPGGTPASLRYDTLRSAAPDGFAAAVCIESDDGADRVALDAELPASGAVFYYLVRAENACGAGTLGSDPLGMPRSGVACP